jgi:hypothetical protein
MCKVKHVSSSLTTAMTWDPAMHCCRPTAFACREVLEGANELRVMLCRDKIVQGGSGPKRGTSVIAACGELQDLRDPSQCGSVAHPSLL